MRTLRRSVGRVRASTQSIRAFTAVPAMAHRSSPLAHDAVQEQQRVIGALVGGISEAAQSEVPWFLNNMPPAYFRQVPGTRRDAHIRAITALAAQGINVPEIQLRDTSGKGFTFITDGHRGGNLNQVVANQLESLPADLGLHRMLLFQSLDGRLILNTYDAYEEGAKTGERRFGAPMMQGAPRCEETMDLEMRTLEKHVAYSHRLTSEMGFAAAEADAWKSTALTGHSADLADPNRCALSLDEYLMRCPSSYVIGHGPTPGLLHQQMRLYAQVAGGDDVAATFHKFDDGEANSSESALLTLALPEVRARQAIERIILCLDLHGLELQRAQVDNIRDGERNITMLRTRVRPVNGHKLRDVDCDGFVADALRLKFVSDKSFGLALSSSGALSLTEAEVALGLADLSLSVLDHPLLSRTHVRERLMRTEDVQPIAAKLAKLLVARFDPAGPLTEDDYTHGLQEVLTEVETGPVGDEESKQLLRAMASAARHTLRTNVHVDGRWALALRLDPRFFTPMLPEVPAGLSNTPFGTFFIAGRHFNGYHNRFRDIARGGLRVVLPPTHEAHNTESRRHFAECFGLSWAQELKNKDIPEGGSKAVCLITPQPNDYAREALMHESVKRMADGMLDLLVPATAPRIVTRDAAALPESEHIFLGPDENITPKDLDWIVARSAKRGYAMPSAFMSSKPRAGINHKEYGVTSEGVAVFLREGLKAIGIAPTEEPWSIKLTGGPDGDVAGNMLKILDRDYGPHVRVVGLADGTACAEDPAGLPMRELLRLVDGSRPLSQLDPTTLSPEGILTLADSPQGIAARNTMHNRVVADAFVPAGGRPATMNGSNWRDFLRADGVTPSARVIVEGANLFLTPEARSHLFEHARLPIVKDSSANKCGVICSSMEIRASMCLDDDAFVAMKAEYVDEVLGSLREMAGLEASLLFDEAARDPSTPLPALSERISFAILRVADALSEPMRAVPAGQLWPLVDAQLPRALATSEHAPTLPQSLPMEYQRSTVVKSLASRLVYREGLAFVENLSDERLPSFALAYLEQEQRVRALAERVVASGQEFGPEVEELLLRGGVRVAAEKAANAPIA